MLTISTEDKSFNKILKIVDEYKSVYGTYGIHPHEAKLHQNIKCIDIVNKVSQNKKIIGIGETGLVFIITIRKRTNKFFEQHILAAEEKFATNNSYKIS